MCVCVCCVRSAVDVDLAQTHFGQLNALILHLYTYVHKSTHETDDDNIRLPALLALALACVGSPNAHAGV